MPKPTPVRRLNFEQPLAEAARRILAARLADVDKHARGLPAPEPVHAMRVAARRLRVAMRLFGLRELEPRVKALQDALGVLRDLQVQDAWLALRDPALQGKRAPLSSEASRALTIAVGEWKSSARPALRKAFAALELPGKLGGHRIRKRLRKALRKFEQRRAVAKSLKPQPTHRLRIAAKQLRYLCELLAPALSSAARLLDELEPLQQSLGDLHDSDVRIELLTRHDRSTLLREEQADREKLAALVAKELKRWSRRGLASKSLEALR
jgi:CHAD domain-containing protein